MAVKKKKDTTIESFIDKGASVKASKEKGFKNILISVPLYLLSEIKAALDNDPGLRRNRWIVEAIKAKLKSDEDNVGRMR